MCGLSETVEEKLSILQQKSQEYDAHFKLCCNKLECTKESNFYSHFAQNTLNKFEITINETFAGKKSIYQGFRIYLV